jgi:hypothetical protein
MQKEKFQRHLKEHLEAEVPECRWCFSIDLQRVEGKIIAQHNFPDGMVLHLSCPRCGGPFSYYAQVWETDYLKGLIFKLHPESKGALSQQRFNDINNRVFLQCEDIQ